MLYTVSAVQILITIDAVDELEKRGRGGKEKVGSCTVSPHWSPMKEPSAFCRFAITVMN
jgi:hypothetical protein